MLNNSFKQLIVFIWLSLLLIACGGSGSSNTESSNSVSQNTVPIAKAQTVTLIEDLVQPILLTGSDADGDNLTYSVLTQPSHGTLRGTGSEILYTPKLNYVGTDSFSFKVNDGIVDSETVEITLFVEKNEKKVREEITSFEIQGNMSSLGSYITANSASEVTLSADESKAYVVNGSSLDIIDISSITSPKLLGNYKTSNNNPIFSVKLSADGSKAYLAAYYLGLQIIDVSIPDNAKLLGMYDPLEDTRDLVLSPNEEKAYIVTNDSFKIIDISNSTIPRLVGSIEGGGKELVVSADEGTAYIANDNGLSIIDINQPATPILLGSYNTLGKGQNVVLSSDGSKAYVGHSKGFSILDISQKTSPNLLRTYTMSNHHMMLSKDEHKVYLASGISGLQIIDVSIPTEPVFLRRYDTLGLAHAVTLSEDEKRAYVADGSSGLQILDLTTVEHSIFLGNYDLNSFTREISLSEDESKAYLSSGRSGLHIIDISRPLTDLNVLGSYDTRGEVNKVVLSRDEAKAYVADGSFGLDILDISNLSTPVLLGNYDTSGFVNDVKVLADGSRAYVLDSTIGLHVIDLSSMTTPRFLGSYDSPDKITDMVLSANEHKMYVANDFSLDIIDINTGGNPRVLNKYDTKNYAIKSLMISKDESKAYVLYRSGFKVFDISWATKVELLGSYTITENTLANKVVFSSDKGRAYLLNDTLGLEVIDISDIKNPKLLGRYYVGDNAYSLRLSKDGSKAYVNTSQSALQIIDLSISKQYKKQDFIEDELVLKINNTEEKNIILNVHTNRNDIINIGNYATHLNFSDYSNQELKIPIFSVSEATGQTIITLTISHSGKIFTRTVYYNVY
ncbi:MAG: Unknown protein [uncultured Sulfurovum sp.]|uniref:Cadherin domain-containing protein n=1 Tax=uncultured Sulfurovum sp. TaxID=269237 RepID=A0A6S6TZ95_9BACT|nr:MAG: Unknown protein [uncultured Sulfurovum sp.]